MANNRKSLDFLLRYETTYTRAFDRAQKALEKMQKTGPQSTTTEELRNEPDTEPEEICETTPSPPTPHQDYEVNGPNSEPQLTE